MFGERKKERWEERRMKERRERRKEERTKEGGMKGMDGRKGQRIRKYNRKCNGKYDSNISLMI